MTNGVDVSSDGRIVITTSDSLMGSTFENGAEDWSIVNNGNGQPTFQPISRGLLSYYIYGQDAVIHRTESGDDSLRWYFNAPAKFLGNQWAAYGGSLNFVLSSAEGNFDQANLNLMGTGNFVVLECTTCKMNAGVTLAMPLSATFAFDGSTTQFVLPLTENAGWLKDPKNVILPWSQPTQCEVVEVLSKLSAIKILGDFTRGYETVALDSVFLKHGPDQPLQCYGASQLV